MKNFFEIDYEIEWVHDEYGEFPLYCAALLFDLLHINNNIIIKNQYSIKQEKVNIIQKYSKNIQNNYYEWPNSPEGNYCIWIKKPFFSNLELLDIFKLQSIYLSYIVPNQSFSWENFLIAWKNDNKYMLLSGQASFICNVIDMDRVLNLNFSLADFSEQKIRDTLSTWEQNLNYITQPMQINRTETQLRNNYGNKIVIQLGFS